ncbi:hypothetical protein FDV58_37685 [Bradyrhizobium elkanii]|uniref:Uncharacterized protein n=1 Tax=Bradyrhizobium elkanii TaxID=29448 RepID=A0A4U6RGS2_BRAEL|nr:hypothetical protein [Bradyrhizobium elkanii]TKV73289.1 hypothetical protein FDV58_37685 [Bradyrhizobium elkanii]
MAIDEIEYLLARQAALEAVLMEVTVPLLVATGPDLARELVENIRTNMTIKQTRPNEHLRLLTEECLQALADKAEARVRAKLVNGGR